MTDTANEKHKAFIQALVGECEGLTLIDADIVLDDARRYLWLKQFTGASDEAMLERLAGPHLTGAARIAEQLVGVVTPLEAEQVFLEVRTVLWMAEFAAIPESLFARQLQAHDERNRAGIVIQ
ncbi:MAG: hypothetical protein HQL36_07965 [Alphaproteobacteria bacterium]|nr:hypothetical protein [Alphaproteobacteria bacterium]